LATRGNYVIQGKRKETLDKILDRFDRVKGPHQKFVTLYEQRERAYRGELRRASNAARWKHQIHPPYAFNLIETVISSSVEQGLFLSARPAPQGSPSLEEAQLQLARTEDVQDLIAHEHRVDEMDSKQRPFYLTAAIGGRGVLKGGWAYSTGAVKRQGIQETEVHDGDGNLLGTVPTITEISEEGILRDHSTCTVVDPRDFLLHEGARAIQPWEDGGAQYLFHRMWYSFEQLKDIEDSGFISDVDYLADYERSSSSDEYEDRVSEVYNLDRRKDQIEVLEHWCFEDGNVHRAWVGNKQVLLRDIEESPFWHGGYPFIVGSSMPLPFSTIGMSEIELIMQLQEMLWEIQNQRLDNLELVNNAIYVIAQDLEDPNAFQAYPGALWEVERPDQVQALTPPYQAAEIALQSEALLKGDLQNVTSAAPFTSGAETASIDQKTATGASIVMNAAQQRMQYRKYEFQKGIKAEAEMRLKNCQQFIDGSQLAHVIGEDGVQQFREISVLDIQGDYLFDLEPMSESNMRQERRNEATQFFQVSMAAAPAFAVSPWPLNLKELYLDMAKHWGKTDAEKFFSQDPKAQAAAMAAQQGGGGGMPSQPAPNGQQPNLGITSDQAVDASSPSAVGGISGSSMLAEQRARAMGGGVSNNGGR
jgi:hypothetical protein